MYGESIQLRHVKRQALLGIDASQAPKIESSAKKIVLSPENDVKTSAMVQFKILPRFRYLAEGNAVCYGDNISLVSTDYSAEYLHTSQGFESTELGILYEVNLSSDRTTIWTLECFFRYSSHMDGCVKTGEVVRLYHPFWKGFVSATATDDRVHLEPSDGDKSEEASSTMSSTMWVVEDQRTISGGLLRTKRNFVLLHLITKKYLVVSPEVLEPGGLGALRNASGDSETYFSNVTLERSPSASAGLLLKSYEDTEANANVSLSGRFRMVHSATGKYLHVVDTEALGVAGRAPMVTSPRRPRRAKGGKILVASPAIFREDYFEIHKVPEDQVPPL